MQEFGPNSSQERMSDVEAQEVLRLHLKRAEGNSDLSVADVAEAIRLPEDEVAKLLSEVRDQKRAQAFVDASPEVQKRKARDVRIALIAAAAFLCVIAAYFVAVNRASLFGVRHEELIVATTNDAAAFMSTDSEAPELATGEQGLRIAVDGRAIVVPCNLTPAQMPANSDLMKVLTKEVEDVLAPYLTSNLDPHVTREGIQQLLSGNFDVQGVRHPSLKFTTDSGITANMTIPVSTDPSKEVQKILFEERIRRYRDLLDMIAAKDRLQAGTKG